MNWKTTLVLGFFVAVLAMFWLDQKPKLEQSLDKTGVAPLENIQASYLRKIEIVKGNQIVKLERSSENEAWSLPGKWPTRTSEVNKIIDLLLGLRSRFTPLKEKVLDNPGIIIKLALQKPNSQALENITLEFEADSSTNSENKFSLPTFLRIPEKNLVLRLGPGLVTLLDHPADFFQQRRLFQGERLIATSKEGSLSSSQKNEKLFAKSVSVNFEFEGKKTSFTLLNNSEDWQLTSPVGKDNLDPKARDAFLGAVPDLWAEKFVSQDLAKAGLAKPERTLLVTRNDGSTITLLIGNVSSTKTSKKIKPPMPGTPPGMPPQEETIIQEMRFAKILDNDQIFEINGDGLKNIFVSVDQIRDPMLARINPTDAIKCEIQQGKNSLSLMKKDGRWKIEAPIQADADPEKVNELLTKFSSLEARGPDLFDNPKLMDYDLDKTENKITITLEEDTKPLAKDKPLEKKTRSVTYLLGKKDNKTKKVFIAMDGFPRVNLVDEVVATLAARPAMAYRGKRILDVATTDINSLKIKTKSGEVAFNKAPEGKWTLVNPKGVDIDDPKVSQLTTALSNFEVTEFLEEKPTPEDLASKYGLDKPLITLEVGLVDTKKPSKKMLIGKAQDPKTLKPKPAEVNPADPKAGDVKPEVQKPGFFARLDTSGPVFVVNSELVSSLDKDALAYLPQDFWKMLPEEISALKVVRAKGEFKLERNDTGWKITEPFSALPFTEKMDSLAKEIIAPKAESFVSLDSKDDAKFGFNKPFIQLSVFDKDKKEKTLLLGNSPSDMPSLRYAKLKDKSPIALVNADLIKALDLDALDLLDGLVLRQDPSKIKLFKIESGNNKLSISRDKDSWMVSEPKAGSFKGDSDAVISLQSLWFNLRADGFAAYGPKADLASFGLDKPEIKIELVVINDEEKEVSRLLEVGSEVKTKAGARFARLVNDPAIFILPPTTITILQRTFLAYVPRELIKLKADEVDSVSRTGIAGELEIAKKNEVWSLIKPKPDIADDRTLNELVGIISELKADSIEAYPATDLKPFGLDTPFAIVTMKLKEQSKKLLLGKEVEGKKGFRFAKAEDGKAIGILSELVVKKLIAPPIFFRDRTITRFPDADQLILERGPRKATFARVNGNWKLTEPFSADADQQQLDDALDSLARLRADELVLEKPTSEDLARFGLDKPETRWQIKNAGKLLLEINLGKRDESATRCYAQIAGKDLVFLLDVKQTNWLQGEFRTRAVWATPLDAVQIDSIKVTSSNNNYELSKRNNVWQSVTKPTDRMNDVLINAMLAALAGLKSERYVVDKGASLNLFGLDPVETTIEIGTPSGKRILLVGRQEGGSKKYYARLADNKLADVFLLSEPDSMIIMKPASAYIKADK